jgi:urease accessory protein
MHLADPVAAAGWRAELALAYERHGARTVLARRRHEGPLVVQKPLYPEGDAVCHTIVVHPPGGIAGGDELEIRARAGAGAHALLTTPGAGKWYRSTGAWSRQKIGFDLGAGAALEWLPQPTILFDNAMADMEFTLDLGADARYIGWEILCFGRTGSGERFSRGTCRVSTQIRRAGKRLWLERGELRGGTQLMESPAGLQGRTVCGTMLAVAPALGQDLLALARKATEGAAALTLLPGVLVARALADSSEAVRGIFARLWSVLRLPVMGREPREPRIWRT